MRNCLNLKLNIIIESTAKKKIHWRLLWLNRLHQWYEESEWKKNQMINICSIRWIVDGRRQCDNDAMAVSIAFCQCIQTYAVQRSHHDCFACINLWLKNYMEQRTITRENIRFEMAAENIYKKKRWNTVDSLTLSSVVQLNSICNV